MAAVDTSDENEFSRMTESQRETILQMVEDIAGEEVKEVTIMLMNIGKETTDEVISEQLGVKINIIRKALYKLYDNKLVTVRSEKDKETGYFIYYWKFHPERIDEILREKREKVLYKLKTRLEYEEGNMFFYCGTEGCKRVNFNEAMEADFMCPTCGKILESYDNSEIIRTLKEKIKKLEQMIQETKSIYDLE